MEKITPLILTYLLIFTVIVLPGCSEKMSIEEAKNLSVSIEATSFVPPPRRINDILEILDQPGEGDTSVIAKLKATADAPQPKDGNDATLTKFYDERGAAARQLGRYKQALDDLRIAYKYAQKSGIRDAGLVFKLGNLERVCGNVKSAIEYLKESLQISKKDAGSSAYEGLVYIYLHLGDFESAQRIKDEGIAFCDIGKSKYPDNVWLKANSARMEYFFLAFQGKYKEAEVYVRTELGLMDSIKKEYPMLVIDRRFLLSENLLSQGRHIEAEIEARRALKEALGLTGKSSIVTGRAVKFLGAIMLDVNRLRDAEQLTKAAIDIYEATGISNDSNEQGRNRLQLCNVLIAQNDYIGATRQYDLIQKQMIENKDYFEKNISRNRNIILALVKSGRTEEAMKSITNAYNPQKKFFGENHSSVAEILGLRGMVKATLHQDKEALQDFAVAVPILAKLEKKNIRVRAILESYLELLSKISGTTLEKQQNINAVAESFKVANTLTALPTQLALAESSARAAAATDPELADMVRKEQDLQKQISILESKLSELLNAPTNEQDADVMQKARATIDSLTQARTTLRSEITSRFPKYAEFTSPGAVTVEMAQKNLQPSEALVSIYATEDKTYTWTIPHKREPKLSVSPLGAKEMASIVTSLRKALDPNPDTFQDIPAFDVNKAYELFTASY